MPDSSRRAAAPLRRNVREGICTAALSCFERSGIRGTAMDDVARAAGVSRPTIYYYFPDKDALVLEVIVRQVRLIHDEIRALVNPDDGLAAVVEASLHTIRISRANQYTQLLTQPDTAGLTARLAESDLVMGLQRELWYPLLEGARKRGELRPDRDFDDLIRWITLIEFTMVTNGDSFGFDDEAGVRDQLEAYLVPALRGSPGSTPGITPDGGKPPAGRSRPRRPSGRRP